MILDAVADWQALSTLYEEADALDDAARAAWLTQLRAQRHRLLPQVERMLEARTRIGSNDFLAALPVLESGDEPAPSQWGEGSRIGAYRLVRHLGSGGMAEVWLADRVDGAFERQVAIKLLFDHPSRARRESFVERFRRERDILASLDHPNIARLHDAGVTPSGQPWLALEYIEGRSIVDWCDERKLTVKERVTLFQQVLGAVAHAHRHLIVHRDLKPANILVSGDGTVHLLDFGIAKLLDSEDGTSQDTELTRSAGRLMTVQYASPEQIRGEPLSTASDLFSAAAVLYELVCGGRAHVADLRSGIGLQQAILEVPARPPGRVVTDEAAARRGEVNAAALRKAIGRDLDAILLVSLEKVPQRRYSSVDALAADLGRWQRNLPIEARPPNAVERTVKFVHRHPLGSGLGLAAVVGLLVTTAIAVAMSLSARREAARVIASRDFLLQIFEQGDPDQARGKELTVKEILRGGRLKAEATLQREPKLQAELLAAIGAVQASLGDRIEADKAFSAAAEKYSNEGLLREAVLAQVARVDNLVMRGDYATAAKVLEATEATSKRAPLEDDIQARLFEIKGTLAWQSDRLPDAAEAFAVALEFARKAYLPTDLRTFDVLTGLASVEAELKRTSAAREHAAEAIRLSRQMAASAPSAGVRASALVVKVALFEGRIAEAIQVLSETVAHCDSTFGQGMESCGAARVRLAILSLRLERFESAAALLPGLALHADQEGSPRRQAAALITAVRVLSAQGVDVRLHPLGIRLQRLATSVEAAGGSTDTHALAILALAEARLRATSGTEVRLTADEVAALQAVEALDPDGRSVLDLRAHARLLRGLALVQSGPAMAGLEALRSAHAGFVSHYGPEHPFALLVQLDQFIALCALGRPTEAGDVVRFVLPALRARLASNEPVMARWSDVEGGPAGDSSRCDRVPRPYLF